nr:immunoglobulin heavy chain junction region [Macaca mulatta]MOY22195.1 immunoglobulin heavy chain junction region [Macaca mulatta]MOY23739.1 immunoglobulin heavy chain junction region [Macaca mulatta]MOY27718.1 immunoglobulin heavy chain junction region [Macaca mulatta]MOY30349.1 immunoglobulin heavy chain junction region [Macaca mulatta]
CATSTLAAEGFDYW